MKSLNQPTLLRTALVLHLAILAGVSAYAQSTDMPMSMNKKTMNSDMAPDCQAMMEKQEKRAADIKAEDAALTAQVAAMNQASEKEKPALLAAIVTRLVENRTTSHDRMSEMQSEMMPHMMDHMSQGAGSMDACPMMKSMRDKSTGPRHLRR